MRALPPFPLAARARGAALKSPSERQESGETLHFTSARCLPALPLHRIAALASQHQPTPDTLLCQLGDYRLCNPTPGRQGRAEPSRVSRLDPQLASQRPLSPARSPGNSHPSAESTAPRMDIVSTLGLSNFVVQFSRISLYPFFDMAHYTMSIMNLKNQPGAIDVAHDSPIACWFSGMLCCFGGAILASLLLGEPPIEPFTNNRNIIMASVIWYLIFYCPYDKFYKCCNFLPSKLFIAGMKEVTRARKIVAGVVDAHSRYRNGWLAVIAVGWAKGAGSGLISNFEQLVRGVWMPERNELLKMSYATKVTLIGAVLFTLQEMNHLPITRHNLIFLYTMFVVSTKVAMVLFNIHHSPFAPMEIALYHMAFSWQSSSSEDHFKTEASKKEELQGKQCPAPSGIPSEEMDMIKRRKTKKSE